MNGITGIAITRQNGVTGIGVGREEKPRPKVFCGSSKPPGPNRDGSKKPAGEKPGFKEPEKGSGGQKTSGGADETEGANGEPKLNTGEILGAGTKGFSAAGAGAGAGLTGEGTCVGG